MIDHAKLPAPQREVNSDAALEAPAEPIIYWLDSGCPSAKQVRHARRPLARLFTLVFVVMAGASGLLLRHQSAAVASGGGQFLTRYATWDGLRIARLEGRQVSAVITQSTAASGNGATPGKTNQCGPAFAQLCPQDSLFRQLPELMTPPDNRDMAPQRSDSSPYRELQLLPGAHIVPVVPPENGDILLERRPGDPG